MACNHANDAARPNTANASTPMESNRSPRPEGLYADRVKRPMPLLSMDQQGIPPFRMLPPRTDRRETWMALVTWPEPRTHHCRPPRARIRSSLFTMLRHQSPIPIRIISLTPPRTAPTATRSRHTQPTHEIHIRMRRIPLRVCPTHHHRRQRRRAREYRNLCPRQRHCTRLRRLRPCLP